MFLSKLEVADENGAKDHPEGRDEALEEMRRLIEAAQKPRLGGFIEAHLDWRRFASIHRPRTSLATPTAGR